ncbi:MAG: gspK [Rhodoferax sp.]|nr:gspK [Rhodoferax sp.]
MKSRLMSTSIQSPFAPRPLSRGRIAAPQAPYAGAGEAGPVTCLIGVDGGGTSTRARLRNVHAPVGQAAFAEGVAGPSALGQGIGQAWRHIGQAIANAFAHAGTEPVEPAHCALGLGLSGAHHAPWRDAFLAANPGYARIALHTDSYAALLGAHGGRPGMIVISGTGSVGEALYADGTTATVGGWGFPSGDEGSGASLGMRAAQVAQFALDGRGRAGPLAEAVLAVTGRSAVQLQAWCAQARQFEYASLAPLVFEAEASDSAAAGLLVDAVQAIEADLLALDSHGELPLVMLGSIGRRLQPRLAMWAQSRCIGPVGDPIDGALCLAAQLLPPLVSLVPPPSTSGKAEVPT